MVELLGEANEEKMLIIYSQDYKIKEVPVEVVKNWEEALKIDPENKRLKQQINELKQSIESEEK